jgi:hypothetical protein
VICPCKQQRVVIDGCVCAQRSQESAQPAQAAHKHLFDLTDFTKFQLLQLGFMASRLSTQYIMFLYDLEQGGDVAHALGCNRLSSLVQSRHDDTAEVLREFIGRLGFSSGCKGRYFWLAPPPRTVPKHGWTFTAT